MTPQDNFMVTAPILAGRQDALIALLSSMTRQPGMADPNNALLPFGRFERVQFARFTILDDLTTGDLRVYGDSFPNAPVYLAFLGDCDGPAETLLAEFVARCGDGLRRIFSHCEGFDANADLLRWMLDRQTPAATQYVNWVGRTVKQIREEAALHDAMQKRVIEQRVLLRDVAAVNIRQHLIAWVRSEIEAGRLRLTTPSPTPLGWQLRSLANLIGVPLLLIVLSPLLLIYLPFFIWRLRALETTDPEIYPRPDPAHSDALSVIEDHDVTNQFGAFGSLKPGVFRLSTLKFLLWLANYATRHIYTRGGLARISTIHAARWVFLDGGKRLFFASNYDSSLDSYMDDFINKVGWGLNILFGFGIGYPRIRWLIFGGCKNEQGHKFYLRRHQILTQVWYKAYPGLSAFDLSRNSRICAGLEGKMSDAEVREWLALI